MIRNYVNRNCQLDCRRDLFGFGFGWQMRRRQNFVSQSQQSREDIQYTTAISNQESKRWVRFYSLYICYILTHVLSSGSCLSIAYSHSITLSNLILFIKYDSIIQSDLIILLHPIGLESMTLVFGLFCEKSSPDG